MKKLWILLLSLGASNFLYASVIPTELNDSRLATVMYTESDVINIRAYPGSVTMIQLEKGETIPGGVSGLAIGDVKAWAPHVQDNIIFLKPIAKNPETNIGFVTNKGRVYSFDLIISEAPHYLVKVLYEKKTRTSDKKHELPCTDGEVNLNYHKWGDSNLAPKNMWDDGRFTCLKFTDNLEMPVAYKVSQSGKESLMNYHFEENIMVLQGISKEFRLRLGDQVLGLRSKDTTFSGHNRKGTTIKATRGLKNE